MRKLRDGTLQVIEAVRSGELVTLTVRGEPVADIVPHGRPRWLSGAQMHDQLVTRAADPALTGELNEIARSYCDC